MAAILDSFDFLRPVWMVIGLLLLPAVVYGTYVSLVDLTPKQLRLSLLVRAVMILLLAAAAAGLTWYRPASQRYLVLAIDDSQSVGPEGRQRAAEVVHQFQQERGRHRLAVMNFAAQPGRVREVDQREPVPPPEDDYRRNGTDLAAAVAVARAAIPPGYLPQLILVSDGQQTHGDLLATAREGSVPISTIALPPRQQPEVQIGEVRAPAVVKIGEPFYVDIVVNTNQGGNADLDLFRDDLRVDLGASAGVELQAGENRVRLRQQLDEPSSIVYTARVRAAQDTQLDDNSASAYVMAAGKPRALLIDRHPESLDPLRWALEDQQITVDLRPPSGVPTALSQLIAYDAIVLSDVPATDFAPSQLEWLRRYVEELGGGLLMLGGEQSFGLGGYYKTPLEAVLPVRSDLEQEREKPSLAMVLVIDRSGSMGGLKLDLAKDAARGTVELLGPRDQIGVVAFDDDAYWVSPLGSAADRLVALDNIDRLSSAGGTNLYPALSQAYASLQSAAAKLKHVIVLSDGISAPADFDRLVADMAAARIVVSTVAVGDQADRSRLQRIAEQGGGRYYECADPRSIPQIFAQETLMASKSAIEEDPFVPQPVRATAVLRGIDLDALPLLLGYVVTRPKATSEVILVTEKGDPLLAWWRYGLGMSLAFTSDVKSRWAVEWLTWPDFSTFWAQCLRHVMRQSQLEGGELRVNRREGVTRVTLELVDDRDAFINYAQTRLAVTGPHAQTEPREYLMRQVAPGTYEVEFESVEPGPYQLDVTSRVGEQVQFRQTIGVHVGYAEELRLRPVDTTLLRQVAVQTGGLVNPTPAELLSARVTGGDHAVPLWQSLVTAAVLLWIVDVALRRLDWFGI